MVLEAATGEPFGDLRYFRRRAARIGALPIDVSRTGYTGDLGYELWVDADRAVELWDRLMDAGEAFGLRPAGMLALDVVRIEAGLILLEVDYTGAPDRTGLRPELVPSVVERVIGEPSLDVVGLMTVPALGLDEAATRSVYRGLRGLRDDLARQYPALSWQHLSMGMTDDFEIAIEEGATMVRIGRAIFGERR